MYLALDSQCFFTLKTFCVICKSGKYHPHRMVLTLCVMWGFHLDRRPLSWEGFAFLYVLASLQCPSPKKELFTVGQDETVEDGFFH